MKKNYTVSLEEEAVEALKPWLKFNGLNFSGYLNTLIVQNLEVLANLSAAGGGKLSYVDLFRLVLGLKKELNQVKNEKDESADTLPQE